MLGFNWIDVIILIMLVVTVIQGVRIGILSQLFVITGFFTTLFISGWLFPHIIRFDDLTLRTTINASLVLIASSYAAVRCLDIGQNIHWSFRLGTFRASPTLKSSETVLGCLPGLVAGVTLVWLLSVTIGRLPFVGLSNSVNDARFVQLLALTLPPPPAVFAAFNSHIDPNAQPYVPIQPKPQENFDYDAQAVQAAAARATPSIVRITSFSCGGVVTGSGFVTSQRLVATNAHVIAGAGRPIIKYNDTSYEGIPVYFDALLDIAILWAPELNAPPLLIAPSSTPLDSTVAVLGYPRGDYQVTPGIVRDTRATAGTSIYNMGNFGRGIYLVQAHVDFGSSGGPIVMQNGRVAGIIFSKSTTVNDTAYALTSVHINDALEQAKTSRKRVGTGPCVAQ